MHESAAIAEPQTEPSAAPLPDQILAEQVRLAYGHLPLALLATMANAFIVVVLLWHRQAPHAWLFAWFSLVLLLSAVRYMHILSYRRQSGTDALAASERRFRYGALASGVLWGGTALFPEHAFIYQAMVAMVLVGMGAGASVTLSSHRGVLQAFLILALLPMTARLALEGQPLASVLAAMGALYLVMISAAASMFHRNVLDNIRLRLEAQQREAALKRAEDQYRHLFEMANDDILIIDTQGMILNANPAAYTRLGYDRQEMLGMPISRLVPPGSDMQALFQRILELGSLSFESEHVCKDGSRVPVEVNAQCIDYQGRRAVLNIARDITERKQAEDRLRTLSQALEQAGEAVIITDDDGLIEYTNPAFTVITAFPPKEVRGQGLQALKMRDGKRKVSLYREMWETVRAGKVWQKGLTARCKDGREIAMFMSFAPIIDDRGNMSHFVGIQRDITEHVELEDRLRQMQKMEAIGTLVGGLAHDFNNVLAGMTGNLFLAKQLTQHLPEVTEQLELSEKLAFSASRMIQQLLAFARKGMVEIRPMDLTRFMRETNRMYELSIPREITYNTAFCEQELPIRGDDAQLQQVIINLLNNARDALAEVEDAHITLRLEGFDASPAFRRRHDTGHEHFARISVEDNGCGIPDAIKARIFEPFFTTKGVGSGTGLGLAMVYGTITSHGGLIDVESAPATGTAFRIYLPLQPYPELQPPVTGDGESPVAGQGETLLVVDDDPQTLETTRHILETLDYRVLTASDGMEAVQVFERNAGDIRLIIMDLLMPKLDGASAYERLKRLHEHVRVIFITGDDVNPHDGIVPDQDDAIVLHKPWSVAQLSQSVRATLERAPHG